MKVLVKRGNDVVYDPSKNKHKEYPIGSRKIKEFETKTLDVKVTKNNEEANNDDMSNLISMILNSPDVLAELKQYIIVDEVKDLQIEIDSLRKEVSNKESRIVELSKRIDDANSRNSILEEQLKNCKSNKEDLLKQLEKQNNEPEKENNTKFVDYTANLKNGFMDDEDDKYSKYEEEYDDGSARLEKMSNNKQAN